MCQQYGKFASHGHTDVVALSNGTWSKWYIQAGKQNGAASHCAFPFLQAVRGDDDDEEAEERRMITIRMVMTE